MLKILIIILITILTHLNLFPKWEKTETPLTVTNFHLLESDNDFLFATSLTENYFSFDGGKNWEIDKNGLPDKHGVIKKIFINNYIFLLTKNNEQFKQSYFYYSTNKGLDWNKIGNENNIKFINTIEDFEYKNNIIYTLHFSSNGSIITSSDFGNTWDTLPNYEGKFDFLEVNNDTIVIADKGGIGSGPNVCNGVLVSIDGGYTWEERNVGLDICNITCLKLDGSKIYIGKKDGFYYSDDLGENWKRAGSLVYNSWVNDIEIIKDTLYLATETGLFKSIDLWKEWKEIKKFKMQRVYDLHYNNNSLFLSSRDRDYSNYYSYYSNDLENFDTLNFVKESSLADFEIDGKSIFFSTYNFTKNRIYLKEGLTDESINVYDDNQSDGIFSISKYNNKISCRISSFIQSGKHNQLMLSKDNGENWYYKDVNIENLNIRDIILLNQDSILVATNETLYISTDFAESFDTLKTIDTILNQDLSKIRNFKKINNKLYLYGEGRIIEIDFSLSYWKSLIKRLDFTQKDSINFIYQNRILDFSKYKNNIYVITHSGGFVEPSSIDFKRSTDNGETWQNIEYKFKDYSDFQPENVYNRDNYVFMSSINGIFLSNDNGESWEEINDGLTSNAKVNGGEFHLYGDTILYCSGSGIFHRPLSELGITLSTEKTEKRNYLWTYPPYPHPTNKIVKVETYWDSALPFSEKDVEIYDITGLKINTNETLTLQKESKHKGHIIWDVSNQNPGIYIMKITHGTETRIRKIMVVE